MKYANIRSFVLLIAVLVVTAVSYGNVLSAGDGEAVTAFSFPSNKKVIVIDAGHGGWDPGKTGVNGENEKNINLRVTENLQMFLENSGAFIVVTRNDDTALADTKKADLKARKNIANDMNADIVVSVHQNAFATSKPRGAQVFYYNTSDKSKLLAEHIQKNINEFAYEGNTRVAKENKDYYILKNTKAPAVIIECGFISNSEDEAMLNTSEYQEKVAWAIYKGINDYLAEQSVSTG